MEVLDITRVGLQWSDLPKLTPHPWPDAYVVPEGTIGAASIIKYIAKKLGKFTKDDAADEEIMLRVLVGMGWEAMCAQLYPNMWWQPGVYQLNGISGHPDGFDEVFVPYARPVTDEFKYTAKSIRVPGGQPDQHKSILDEWMWMCQDMAYIKLNPTYEVLPDDEPLYGRFHVCWAMGNYTKHTLDEVYMRYLVQYERQEIERNWQMLEDHRTEAMKDMKSHF